MISKKIETVYPAQSSFSSEEDAFTALSTSALLAKSSVPYSHRRVADNYVIIKRVYRFQAVLSPISNAERQLLQKYDFNTLEFSTIKQVNEELSYLKKWSTSTNELLRRDADALLQIRCKVYQSFRSFEDFQIKSILFYSLYISPLNKF